MQTLGAGVVLRSEPRPISSSTLRGSPLRQRTGAPSLRPCRVTFSSPRAISFPNEPVFGHGHGHHHYGPPARDLSEEEKKKMVEQEEGRIKQQTEARSKKLRNEAHIAHLDHELKFGRLMFAQESYESALAHFNKVVAGSAEDSYHRGEGTLQKAACLEKLGRQEEAKALYESLILFRAPYPNIKRRAAQALFGADSEGKEKLDYDDYMYRMFLSGFGTYMPKEKYVESQEEKTVMQVLPWAMLLMAPVLLLSLLFFQK